MLLRTLFVLVTLITIVVGGRLAWQVYQRHNAQVAGPGGTHEVPSETRAASVSAVEEQQTIDEDAVSETPDPALDPTNASQEREASPLAAPPMEGAPVEEAPTEQSPTRELPMEETPAQEPLVEEPPLEEAPVEEALVVVVPASGAIDVRSVPFGAEVRIAGGVPQHTPLHLDQLAPGSYPVEVTLPGHRPYATTVEVGAGEIVQVDARLERLTGRLSVASEPAGIAFAVRSLDGGGLVREGVTPEKLQLPTGRYVVNFRREGASRSSIVEVDTARPAIARANFPVIPVAAAETIHPQRDEVPEQEPPAATQAPSSSPSLANTAPPGPVEPPVAAITPQPANPDRADPAGPPVAKTPAAGSAGTPARAAPQPETAARVSSELVLTPAEGPPLEGGIFELGNVEVPPRLIERVDPVVPRRRFRSSDPARVELVVVIDRMGRVASAAVHSTTDESLVGPCLRAVRLWRFRPASERGKAVPVRVAVPLVFQAP